MRVDRICRLAILAALAFGATQVAYARNLSSNPYKTPCHDDRLRLCSAVSPGKAGGCLKQHLNDLSPACKAFVTKDKATKKKN